MGETYGRPCEGWMLESNIIESHQSITILAPQTEQITMYKQKRTPSFVPTVRFRPCRIVE